MYNMAAYYKHLVIERSAGSPDSEEVRKIEDTIGVPLPEGFKDFLMVANGGQLSYGIRVQFPSGETEVFCFSGVYRAGRDKKGDYGFETFIGEIEHAREWRGTPKEVVPFARDAGGSSVYLDLTPEGAGRVVAFIHGMPPWTGLREEDSFVELAPSFSDYVDLLFDLDDEDYSTSAPGNSDQDYPI
jgi:hypothetical protein